MAKRYEHFPSHNFTYEYPDRTWSDRIQDAVMAIGGLATLAFIIYWIGQSMIHLAYL